MKQQSLFIEKPKEVTNPDAQYWKLKRVLHKYESSDEFIESIRLQWIRWHAMQDNEFPSAGYQNMAEVVHYISLIPFNEYWRQSIEWLREWSLDEKTENNGWFGLAELFYNQYHENQNS